MKKLTNYLKIGILLIATIPLGLLSSSSCYGQKVQGIKIGKQEWMGTNLNISTFRNGDSIPEAKTVDEFYLAGKSMKPAYYHFNGDPVNGEKYGKLYNWYAVTDPRGLSPLGWHIPTSEEWNELIIFLGGDTSAALKMKSTSGWNENGNGNNASKFNGLPGGNSSNDIGTFCGWWSSSDLTLLHAKSFSLVYAYNRVRKESDRKMVGHSVRCVKD